MRIAMVTQSYYPHLGGVTEHVHHLSTHLRRLGHRVTVITAGPARSDDNGTIRMGRNAVFPINGAMVNVTVGLGLKRRLAAIFRQDFDLIHIHCPLEPTLPLAALMAVGEAASPSVGTFHMCAGKSPAYEVFGGALRPYAARLDARIAVSVAARRFAHKYFPGTYAVIPNGIDCGRFARPAPLVSGISDGKINFLFVGRLDLRKNVPWLIAAFKRLYRRNRNCRLVIVGEGLMRPACRIAAGLLDHDAIRFVGRVPPEELPSYYRSSHVFCSVPAGSESFGIVLLEAMAAGLPIVGTSIDGYREIVTDGSEGLLVRPGDTETLVRAMASLAEDAARRAEMGACGRRTAGRYDWGRVALSIEAVYDRLTSIIAIRGKHAPVQRRVRLS